jgi:carbamoyltransferase
MWVLGLAVSHNGAVALIEDGVVRVAIQLERLERVKRFALRFANGEPAEGVTRAVNYCLRAAGIEAEDLDAVAATTPWALPASATWPRRPIAWVPHHLAHAEYALHFSRHEPGLVLIVDGHGSQETDRPQLQIEERVDASARIFPGEAETVSIYRFDGTALSLVYRMCGSRDPVTAWWNASIGGMWELASSLAFGRRDQAGKVMGLAAYGEHALDGELFRLEADGRLSAFPALLHTHLPYRHMARAVQDETTRVLLELLERARPWAPGPTLYYSGGVALNVVSNERIVQSGLFDTVAMNGSCEDNGTAIGAALAVYHAKTGRRVREDTREYLGTEYHRYAIRAELDQLPVGYEDLSSDDLIDATARSLAQGNVVGWFQGGSEFGPRALGNRSILADARDRGVKDRLNGRIKHRESFRPYGACVRGDRASAHFDLLGSSPVMLRQAAVVDDALPAITHIDGSCRVQTVEQADNPRLFDLLTRFSELTSKPVLLNTSMNVAGEPIAETPRDALLTLLRTEIDALAIGNYWVRRK